jgi:chromosome segregation protein
MDRTVLDFPRGITGVVGPNGCGKSNIVDALRWVLGEQSAKHLRGQTMEDVIFAGNERFGPLGAAEVTITLDNDGSLVGADDVEDPEDEASVVRALKDVPEIEVTRRLFRSGESEYLINGRPCRLRDITELFLGTGVGTKAYSIIEQGRVGQIVGAKPEDLRLFVEEAAGTTLYRSRKLAAERKIERTRNNLLRVNDIVSELERQAASLKRQVRGAVRYKELKVEEEELDRRLVAHRLRGIERRISEVRGRLDEVAKLETELREGIQALSGERDSSRIAQNDVEIRTEEARKAFYDAKGKLAGIEQERRFLESRAAELESLCARATEEIAEADRRIEAAERQGGAVERERGEIEVSLGEVVPQRTAEEEKARNARAASAEKAEQLEALKSRVVESLATEASLNNEIEAVQRQRTANAERLARTEEERGSLQTLTEKLLSDVDVCKTRVDDLVVELDSTTGGKESASEKLGTVLSRKADAQRWADASKSEASGLASRFESLQELNDGFEDYGDGVRAFMSNGGRERTGATAVIADVIEIDQGYERAVAAVLQDRLQYVVVPSPYEGIAGATYLRQTGTGRASFVPRAPRHSRASGRTSPEGFSMLAEHVRVQPEYERTVSVMLEGVVVADSLGDAAEQWKRNGAELTFVTRSGDVLDPAGVVTGGSGKPVDEGILARKAELRGIKITLVDAEDKARTAHEAFQRVVREAEEASRQLEGLDRKLHELTVDRVAAEGDLELQRQNLQRTEERAKTVDSEIEGIRAENLRLESRLREIREEQGRAVADRGRLDEQRNALEAARVALDEEHDASRASLEGLKVKEVELTQKREAIAQRLAGIESAKQEYAERRTALAERLGGDRDELSAARSRLSGPELDATRVAADVERSEQAFAALRAETEQIRERLAVLQRDLDGRGTELEQRREERSGFELALKQAELERESLNEAARERIGADAQSIAESVEDREENPNELDEQLERVRNSIRRLGVVNVGAVAELEELESRLVELTSQRDDLEKSIEDLRGTISRLNRLSRQRFRETFEAVNEIFRETFPRLFQGGKAWLTMTDEQNLLETGVEIFVQPPGKKVGNLNLLSGGEKALTAVSLIFSLFLYKPSPFCVLDEVDAPLDDTNIGRFARMVADMSDRSQFVLITHNKRTMESCDMLYGVTMREPGVSKIVSVEMSH